MSTIDLVMLDCDGVLIDSEFIAAQVECERYAAEGYEMTVEEFSERFAGLSEERIAAAIGEELGRSFPADFAAETTRLVTERIAEEVEPIDGVERMLAGLSRPLCVCSNSSTDQLRRSLGRAGLWDTLAEHIFSARDLGTDRMKPAPDVFVKAAEAMGVDPHRAVAVEDSAHGVEAARAAGARVIGFTGGRHSWNGHADALTDAGAATVVARHADLPATIDALAGWDELAM